MTNEAIGIVGMGVMGRGIAEVAAKSGYETVLVKATPGEVDGARRTIAQSFERAVARGKLSNEEVDAAWSRLVLTRELDAVAGCRLVVESIVEDLSRKRALLSDLEARVAPTTVIATNTSSLPIAELAGSLQVSVRFLGLHFFSPVPAMQLVEVATTARTDAGAVEEAQRFVERLGKTAVRVGETAGYIVNRLLVPLLLDAIAALESRVAPAHAIDTAMKLGCAHPMGPLALADAIGLDVVYAMARTLHAELADRRYSPPALLRRLVLNGHLGKKAKVGIYDYSSEPLRENGELWARIGE